MPGFSKCAGTTARTISPVRKSCLGLFFFGLLRGKPNAFTRHNCQTLRRLASNSKRSTYWKRRRTGLEGASLWGDGDLDIVLSGTMCGAAAVLDVPPPVFGDLYGPVHRGG